MKKALFWDFDGTLVKSLPLWSTSLLRALKDAWPGCLCTLEDVRPHLRSGFPWHTPVKDHTSMTGEAWWETMYRHFDSVCLKLGAPEDMASRAARGMRDVLLLPDNYALYDDTLSVLQRCREMGFSQYIVSNNHPDLRKVLNDLDLSSYFVDVIVSGEIGYDKPRKEIFECALQRAGHPDICFMIGDNPAADGEGAQSANIPPLLVHLTQPCPDFPAFETLCEAAIYIQEALYADTRHDNGRL
jgi:putative hydrolase of the HAD superfamily